MTIAAVVQAAPVWLDHDATVQKTVALMEDAAGKGAKLVVFPESWLPGYPMWVWFLPPMASMDMLGRFRANAATMDGPGLEIVGAAAKRLGLHVVLGMTERDGGSLYCTQAFFDDQGVLIGRRRKLKPTHAERMVWGEGDGSGLIVLEGPVGRLGGLNCWENMQPLVKMALYAQQEQVHALAWPWFCIDERAAPALSARSAFATTVAYALEGQCWVLASTAVMTEEIRSQLVPEGAQIPLVLGGGGAMIVAPDSTVVVQCDDPTWEGVLVADIDLTACDAAKALADPVGHYARPDVVQLLLHRAPRAVVVEGAGDRRLPQTEGLPAMSEWESEREGEPLPQGG